MFFHYYLKFTFKNLAKVVIIINIVREEILEISSLLEFDSKIMREKTCLFILSILMILWMFWIRYALGDALFNISEWGGYILCVPLVYSLATLFSVLKTSTDNLRLITTISIGCVIPIFLANNLLHSFYLEKLAMILVGMILTIMCSKKD